MLIILIFVNLTKVLTKQKMLLKTLLTYNNN